MITESGLQGYQLQGCNLALINIITTNKLSQVVTQFCIWLQMCLPCYTHAESEITAFLFKKIGVGYYSENVKSFQSKLFCFFKIWPSFWLSYAEVQNPKQNLFQIKLECNLHNTVHLSANKTITFVSFSEKYHANKENVKKKKSSNLQLFENWLITDFFLKLVICIINSFQLPRIHLLLKNKCCYSL